MGIREKMWELYYKFAKEQGDKLCWFCGKTATAPEFRFKKIYIEIIKPSTGKKELTESYICDECLEEQEMHQFILNKTHPQDFWTEIEKLEAHPGGPEYIKIAKEFFTRWKGIAQEVIGKEYAERLVKGSIIDKNAEEENK